MDRIPEQASLPSAQAAIDRKRFVAVVMERIPLTSRWQSEKWEAKGVLPGSCALGGTPHTLYDDGSRREVLYSGLQIELKLDELESYFLNLTSPEPKAFVLVRDEEGTPRPAFVSLSYAKAVGWMDANETVDAVPLPPELYAWVGEFVERFFRPKPRFKRERK